MTLIPTRNSGWSTGFGTLTAKELRSWWGTRRWAVHLVLWLVVETGFVLLVSLEGRHNMTPAKGLAESLQVFFQVGGFFALIGAVLVTQGAIVGERSSGTAAWVLTKPTTRAAFVLSKFTAITATFLLLSLVIPAIGSLIVCQAIWHSAPVTAHFLEAFGIQALHQTFYIALTLMLGTLFSARGPVSGLALGFWVAGNIAPNLVPKWVVLAMPWTLQQAAAAIATWQPVPVPIWIPSAATGAWIVIMLAVAVWRFNREEF